MCSTMFNFLQSLEEKTWNMPLKMNSCATNSFLSRNMSGAKSSTHSTYSHLKSLCMMKMKVEKSKKKTSLISIHITKTREVCMMIKQM